jgi:hypothetical protein
VQRLDKLRNIIEKWPILFFAIASLIQYRKILFFSKKIGWDTLDAIFPHFLYMVDCFKQFSFPYYNPLTVGGFSFGQNFFTAFLLNPIDVFLALIGTLVSPLYIFQLAFPIFATLSGFWFYQFLKKINNDEWLSLLGGLAYLSGILFPLAGQSPFFFSFVLFPFLLSPFSNLVQSRKSLNILCAIVLLVTFLLKTYFFFIPFLMAGAFLLLLPQQKNNIKVFIFSLVVASFLYLIMTYPILIYLKQSLVDLNGSFISPEPRLRSLSPEKIFFSYSLSSVIGDLIDARLIPGSAWTNGFNLSILFLFIIQFFSLSLNRSNLTKRLMILGIMLFSMCMSYGYFYNLHKSLPVIGSFRWGFSYSHFAQICYLLLICFVGIDVKNIKSKVKYIMSSVFLLSFGWIIYQSQNIKPLVLIIPVLMLIYFFHKKEKYFLGMVIVFTFAYLGKNYNFNEVDGKTEYRDISHRSVLVNITDNKRDVGQPGDYLFEDRSWLYKKNPTLNGYNNSIHPIFWYLKSKPEVVSIVIPICHENVILLKKREAYPINDNEYLEAYRNDLLSYIEKSKCTEAITNLSFNINQLKFTAVTSKSIIIQNLDGFELENNSKIEQVLPGGLRIVESKINEQVVYKYKKSHVLINQVFLAISFLLSAFVLIFHLREWRSGLRKKQQAL